jgi:uncharacterized membrane protein YhhN
LGFVWVAATQHASAPFIAAFVLSLIGDALLLGKSKRWLSLGILAFFSAHAAFVAAFVLLGVNPREVAIGLAVVVGPSLLLARWILTHASADMRPKVLAYVTIISLMVATSYATTRWFTAAAVLFYLSDICVARHRFVRAQLANRLIGLPLYYAAQWMFAHGPLR